MYMMFESGLGRGHLDFQVDHTGASWDKKADFYGARVGCVSVNRHKRERGSKAMALRYANVLMFYGVATEEIGKVRPDIASQITSPLKRLPGESLIIFDPELVTLDIKTYMPGPETPWGYAFPRLMLAYAEDAQAGGCKADRILRSLDLLDETLEELGRKGTATTLLVAYAERLVRDGGMDSKAALANTISEPKWKQDTLHTHFGEIVAEMSLNAPVLWNAYTQMSSSDRVAKKIADITLE